MLSIVTVPNTILTTPSPEVKKIDRKILNLVSEMEQILLKKVNPQGVGLAASQVGVNLAIFIIKPSKKAKVEAFINPRIVKISQSQLKLVKVRKNQNIDSTDSRQRKTKLEGCLSIPKIWAPVSRANKIYLEYQDLNGKKHKRWFSGFKAVIIQHETDHLQGILFTQRALEQNSIMYEEKEGKLVKFKSL